VDRRRFLRTVSVSLLGVLLATVLALAADPRNSSRADLIASILSYRASLDRLWEFHVTAVSRASAEVEKRRDLHARGILTARELEESERALEVAEGKMAGTRREMVVADQALSEAMREPRPSTDPPPTPPRQVPARPKSVQRSPSLNAVGSDVTDLPSLTVGDHCVSKGMLLKNVGGTFSSDPRWEFRWDEKMVTRGGLIAGLIDLRGTESPYLLLFSFTGKTIGEARLTKIAWTGKQSEWTTAHERRVGCR
jgi:hypothetical protein